MTLYLSDGDEPPSCGNDDGTSNVSCQSTVYTKSSLSEVASQVDFSDFYKDVSEWISSLGGGESLPGTCSSMGSPQSRSNQGLEPLDAKFLVSALTELDALNSVSASNESSVSTSNPLAGFYQSPLSSYNDDTIRDRNDYDANNGSKSFIQHHHSSLQAVLSSLLLGGLSLGEAIEHGVNRAASTATIAANRFRDSLSYQRDLNMTASEGFSHAKLRESDAEYRHSDDQFSYNSATHVDTRCFTNECKVCRSNEMQGNMATSSCSPAATSSESCYSPVNGLRGLAESVLYAVAAALGTTRAGSGLTSVAMICWALVQSSIGELRRLQSIVCHMGSNVTQLRDCLEKTIQRLGEVRKDLYDMTEAKQRVSSLAYLVLSVTIENRKCFFQHMLNVPRCNALRVCYGISSDSELD